MKRLLMGIDYNVRMGRKEWLEQMERRKKKHSRTVDKLINKKEKLMIHKLKKKHNLIGNYER